MSEARAAVIAVASGKGGTGKTTVAAHLAREASRTMATLLVDLDVEAPDARGYFPNAEATGAPEAVTVPVPRFSEANCDGCGACGRSCHFGSILALGRVVTVNPSLCKGCGRCVAACHAGALVEEPIEVGVLSGFRSGALALLEGRMKIGDIRSTAVIEAAKRRAAAAGAELQIRDCPPGVSCPATHAIEGADYVLLVAEPTEFSRHDLEAALKLVKGGRAPAGVVINKDGFGDADLGDLCGRYGVPVVGRIGFSRERAATGAAARLWDSDEDFAVRLRNILDAALSGAGVSAGGRA